MTFLVLLVASSLVLILAPFYLVRRFSAQWKLNRLIFWKAGLMLLFIQIFYLTVISNLSTMVEIPVLYRIILFGVLAGLFFELGRFLVLDRFMKKVRTFKEGIFFALGWTGLSTILMGFGLLAASFGLNTLLQSGDISSLIPADAEIDMKLIKEMQEEILTIARNFPYLGIEPLLESAAWFVINIALTLMVLMGITKGEQKYVWSAVAFHSFILIAVNFISTDYLMDFLTNVVVFAAFAAISYFLIRKIKELYPKQLK